MSRRWDNGNWKKRLDRELSDMQFDARLQERVLNRAAAGRKDKHDRADARPSFWNRELRIPLPAAALLVLLMAALPAAAWLNGLSPAAAPPREAAGSSAGYGKSGVGSPGSGTAVETDLTLVAAGGMFPASRLSLWEEEER